MSGYQGALGTALFALGAVVTLGLQNVLQTGTAADAIVTVVYGQDIRQSDVDREAGCELQKALTRVDDLRHEAREYLVGKTLIEVEAVQSNRTYREIFTTEITARIPVVSDAQVRGAAENYAPGAEPSPQLLSAVRDHLETEALRRRLDRYLADLSDKYHVQHRIADSAGEPRLKHERATALQCRDSALASADDIRETPSPSGSLSLPVTAPFAVY